MPYRTIKVLGEGAFGKVSLIEDEETKQLLVYKSFKSDRPERKAVQYLKNEAEVLQTILPECNPYLSCIAKTEDKEGKIQGIFIDYVPHSFELADFLEKNPDALTFYGRFVIMLRLLEGLAILHKLGVVHRDIKTENVLINPNTLQVRYIDYGLSCVKSNQKCRNRFVGSRFAMSPELLESGYTERPLTWLQLKKADVWALGILFNDLCFPGVDIFDRDIDIVRKRAETLLMEKLGRPMTRKTAFFYKIIVLLLDPRWETRPSAQDLFIVIRDNMAEELLEVAETTDLYRIERRALDEARAIRIDPETARFPSGRRQRRTTLPGKKRDELRSPFSESFADRPEILRRVEENW